MKEFTVKITETLQKSVIIEANSKDEALDLAEQRWENADVILDADDFVKVDFQLCDSEEV